MQRQLIMSIATVLWLADAVFAQNRIVVLNQRQNEPFAPPGIPASASQYIDETEALRRQLLKSLIEKTAAMSADELRRAIVESENVRAEIPPAAREILEVYDARSTAIKREANRRIKVFKKETIDDLQAVQDLLTRDGQLDEAVAVRDMIRALRIPPVRVRPDPGRLTEFGNQVGKSFYFKVTGNKTGSVWGTKIYTSDSRLATAAVHAGILANNQTAVVKVTILAGQNAYTGSTSVGGVTSSSYGQYPSSYRVEAMRLD